MTESEEELKSLQVGSVVKKKKKKKKSSCNPGDRGSVPGVGRPPVEGNGNPLQYSCLKNLKDRGAY